MTVANTRGPAKRGGRAWLGISSVLRYASRYQPPSGCGVRLRAAIHSSALGMVILVYDDGERQRAGAREGPESNHAPCQANSTPRSPDTHTRLGALTGSRSLTLAGCQVSPDRGTIWG